jgi:vitamin B12 transporter
MLLHNRAYPCIITQALLVKQIITILLASFALQAKAQIKTIDSVTITTNAKLKSIQTLTPSQTLTSTNLQEQNITTIADAARQFAGVQVKDYGGAAGLKTISIRSLGANHTGFLYDGMAIADAQGGQIDFGRFNVENVKAITLFNAQPTNILLPARAFNYSNIIVAQTKATLPLADHKLHGQADVNLASFGNFSSSLLLQKKINKKIQNSLQAWVQTAKNNYKFTSLENKDSSTTRQNSNIHALKLEYDFVVTNNDSNAFQLKAYYYQSKRGLPGSVILYNSTNNKQTLTDKNFFTQAQLKKQLTKKISSLFSIKFAADNIIYIDSAYPNSLGYFKNNFKQQEWYGSVAIKKQFTNAFSASISSDYAISNLERDDIFDLNFATPTRNAFLQNVAVSYQTKSVLLQGNAQYLFTNENVRNGNAAKSYNNIMPTLLAQIKPIANNPFMLRFYYKKIYRVPTFNDLYFTNIGNTNLKPELAQQINFGTGYSINSFFIFKQIQATADAYVNKVTDKILAVPRQNLFQWSMQNIGSVNIKGLDGKLQIAFKELNNINLFSTLTYSYQQALDVSNSSSDGYKKQIAYTPQHNFNANIIANYKTISVGYNITSTSARYTLGLQTFENTVQPFVLHDANIAFELNKHFRLKLELNNLFNTTYQIVQYYPMPLRNYRLQLQINF